MNTAQAELVEKYQESKLHKHNLQGREDDEYQSESDDELLELLQDDSVLDSYRDERMLQLKKEFAKIDAASDSFNLGNVISCENEKELMDLVPAAEKVIVHFHQPAFEKCKRMNEKLALVAEKHLTIKVVVITATNAPFLVDKLKIKMLPFVVLYKNGKELDRLVGFEKLGNDVLDFKYEALEQLLYRCNFIDRKTINFGSTKSARPNYDEDSDDDLDI